MDEKNLDIYGNAPIPWSRALEQLEAPTAGVDPVTQAPRAYWLATTCPDGRPHATGVGAFWLDGKVYFTSGPGTRKSRNLAANPGCVITVSLPGIDLVIEGTCARVTDTETLQRVVELAASGGWPARVSGDAITAEFSAPSAGPPPWYLYAVTPTTAFGVATAEPHGASRWRFDA